MNEQDERKGKLRNMLNNPKTYLKPKKPECETCDDKKVVWKKHWTEMLPLESIPCPACQKPESENIMTKSVNAIDYFDEEHRKSFVEREKKLKAQKEWPNTNWYNDKEFYDLYYSACQALDAAEKEARVEGSEFTKSIRTRLLDVALAVGGVENMEDIFKDTLELCNRLDSAEKEKAQVEEQKKYNQQIREACCIWEKENKQQTKQITTLKQQISLLTQTSQDLQKEIERLKNAEEIGQAKLGKESND